MAALKAFVKSKDLGLGFPTPTRPVSTGHREAQGELTR